jgi:hypothetical protein
MIYNIVPMLESKMQYSIITPGIVLYSRLNKYLKTKMDPKPANTTTTSIHAFVTCIFLAMFMRGNKESKFLDIIIKINSGGYFIFDTINIFQDKKTRFKLQNIVYIYHHITSALILFLNHREHNVIPAVFYAELSTIPTSMLYFHMKSRPNDHNTIIRKALKTIQLVTFLPVRIFVIGYYMYMDIFHPQTKNGKVPLEIYMTVPIYIFGLIWSAIIIIQNIKKTK